MDIEVDLLGSEPYSLLVCSFVLIIFLDEMMQLVTYRVEGIEHSTMPSLGSWILSPLILRSSS